MKFNKKGQALYIDSDQKYHFIVGEMLKNKIDINFASDLDSAIEIIKKTEEHLDTVIICVDNIDHDTIINSIILNHPMIINLILVSSDYDAIHMYDLVAVYGASDYLSKPFSKQGIYECYTLVKEKGEQIDEKKI